MAGIEAVERRRVDDVTILTLLAREGLQYMEAAPWLALWPGLCLTIVVYCLNMFGDALRGMLSREGMPLRWMQWPTG